MEGHPESLILKKVNGDASKIEARTIIDAAREGDPIACQVYDKYIYYLAIGIVAIINAFDPEVIVLGGGVSKAGSFLLDAVRARVLRILGSLPVYAEVQAGGRSFFLAHTVPGKRKMRHPESCRVCDFLMGEPEYEICYDPKRIIVTGHTVTSLIDKASRGRIWRGNGHIAIDCGAVYSGVLGCLCLDTLEEFYVE